MLESSTINETVVICVLFTLLGVFVIAAIVCLALIMKNKLDD